MGRQHNMYFSGTRGNLVYYELNGGFYMRSKPAFVQQTAATKNSADKFGIAVRTAKLIRASLAPVLPNPRDKQMILRFNTALYKWLLTNPENNINTYQPAAALEGFSFNATTALAERMKPALQANWQIPGQVAITIPVINPERDIAAPAHTIAISLQLVAVCCDVLKHTVTASSMENILIPYSNAVLPAQHIIMAADLLPDNLALIVASLKYTTDNSQYISPANKLAWEPCGITDAVYRKS